ncbi:MAG TPA: ribosome silencing factor [Acidobacteriaceae bacterium]|nr:ribosome silencing factor [Acidobacteriaceae bacterium]
MTKTEIRRMVAAAAAACEDKKAEQIRILELDPADSGFTDYFLICSGTNDRQNQAIATAVEERMERDFNTRPNSIEGYRLGEWILLDYVDFVVHIFSEEKRDFYHIERLRKTATTLDLEELKASLTKRVSAVRKKQAAKKTVAKKTPAKKVAVKKVAAKKVATKKASKARPVKPSKGKAARVAAKMTSKPKSRKAASKRKKPL